MLASEGGHVAGSSASCHAVLRPSLTRHAPRQRTDGPGWEQIADLLPHHPRQGGRWRCHRTVINAVIRKPEELPSPHVTGHFLSPVNVTAEHQPVDRAETERASRFVTLPPAPRWGRDTATAVTPPVPAPFSPDAGAAGRTSGPPLFTSLHPCERLDPAQTNAEEVNLLGIQHEVL